ncbi:hypothetical protein J6590_056213 [Homalodisca vitripennis]|nr:hypothetical protein J6590_056213 [Homalodisca vitripennis]
MECLEVPPPRSMALSLGSTSDYFGCPRGSSLRYSLGCEFVGISISWSDCATLTALDTDEKFTTMCERSGEFPCSTSSSLTSYARHCEWQATPIPDIHLYFIQ